MNIEGYARIDAFVRIYKEKIEVIIIEINTLPAMTPATCIFHQAALFGYKPFDFIECIINYGFNRHLQKIANFLTDWQKQSRGNALALPCWGE